MDGVRLSSSAATNDALSAPTLPHPSTSILWAGSSLSLIDHPPTGRITRLLGERFPDSTAIVLSE
jgi:hypothetical protein